MKKISLTQGKFALVDDCDYEHIKSYKWYAYFDGYNWYSGRKKDGKKRTMHQEIMGIPRKGFVIDHIDHNGLNNTRSNLRICTHSQNKMNSKNYCTNSSGFRGVSLHARGNFVRWTAQIQINGKRKRLGYFITKEKAYEAYVLAAKEHYGEYANVK